MARRRVLDMVQPHLLGLDAYEAVDPPEALAARAGIPESEVVKLNANENPYGPSPKVAKALAEMRRIHLYPDPAQVAAREAVGRYVGLSQEHVVVGNGSDEIIDLLFRSLLAPGEAIVNAVPTFGMYAFSAQVCGGRTLPVERDARFALNVKATVDACNRPDVKAVIFASPNNPSGNATAPQDILRLLEADCLVIVDEAYVEFDARSVASLVPQHPNLVVLRTLSKWAGLAGLRVGYGLMAPELADVLMRAKPPYNISQAAETALLASLADVDTLNERAGRIIAERARLAGLLAGVPGVNPLPSEANFILARMPQGRGKVVYEGLARRGVFVRYYARGVLADYLRVSVGTPEQTDRLMAALAEAMED
ncbi:MAG: histidinol-phosphate transaminase [Chloroflexota bacterium]